LNLGNFIVRFTVFYVVAICKCRKKVQQNKEKKTARRNKRVKIERTFF
jgi:hypothetical protein